MIVRLYQINMSRDEQGVCFLDYLSMQSAQGFARIDASIYDLVDEGRADAQTLEDLFVLGNRSGSLCGPLRRARSISVSDVVEVVETGDGAVMPGFYFCDAIGWQRIDFAVEAVGRCT